MQWNSPLGQWLSGTGWPPSEEPQFAHGLRLFLLEGTRSSDGGLQSAVQVERRACDIFSEYLFLLQSCSRFNQWNPQAVASRSSITLPSQWEKKWETLFLTRGRWFVPTCKLFNLRFKQSQGIGQIYLSSDEWVALFSHLRRNPILHRLGARLFLTEPAFSSSGSFSHSSRRLVLKWMAQ